MGSVNLGDGYVLWRSEDDLPRVVAPGGEVLPGSAVTLDRAIGLIDRHKAAVREKTRRCLCCGHDFKSSHIGNRMCRRCRSKPEGMV